MKISMILMSIVFATSSFARDGFITTKEILRGDKTIEAFKNSVNYDYFQETFSGEDNCKVKFVSTESNDYAEFIMTRENKKTERFYISDLSNYTFITDKSDGSDGEAIGWYTTTTFKKGKYSLSLALEGDSGFNIYYSKDNKKILECDTGF
jgi:hypothetical protein